MSVPFNPIGPVSNAIIAERLARVVDTTEGVTSVVGLAIKALEAPDVYPGHVVPALDLMLGCLRDVINELTDQKSYFERLAEASSAVSASATIVDLAEHRAP